MKINETIKARRKALELTQEKVANILGVSPAAVYKWEKGITYPDITLLPPLARLLQVDLNTLLSFKEELTDREIGEFANELALLMEQDFDRAFQTGIDKAREYPSCEKLLLTIGVLLNSGMIRFGGKEKEHKEKQVEELLLKTAQSSQFETKQQGISALITYYMNQEDYDNAQALLDQMPRTLSGIQGVKFTQANLFIRQKKYKEAEKLLEEIILSEAASISTAMISLIEIAVAQKDMDLAKKLADKEEELVNALDLWEYNKYVGKLYIAIEEKNKEKTLDLLKKIAKTGSRPWNINESVLYQHIKTKENSSESVGKIIDHVMAQLGEDETFDFLKDNPAFIKLMEEYQ